MTPDMPKKVLTPDGEINPYASSSATVPASARSRDRQWERVGAMVTFLTGLGVGVVALGMVTWVILFVDASFETLERICPGWYLWLGSSVALIVSARLFWTNRSRIALALFLVGGLIPLVYFAIRGF